MSTAATLQFQPVIDMKGPLPIPTQWRPAADLTVAGDPLQRVWNLCSSAARKYYVVYE